MSYEALKVVHVACALISYALFVLRGIWRFTGSRAVERRWVKVAPHINDTVLLAAALGLAWIAAGNPALHGFFIAKISGLLVYILLGITAFRWARTRRTRVAAWLGAQGVFFYIVGVAITKSPSLGLAG
jgi:uncharacterized membrane protein SirB2